MRFRRSWTAPPRRRSFSSATRVPGCGPCSRLRRKRTTARRMPWTDGAGAWSRDSPIPSGAPRTFPSADRPGYRSSDGRSGRDPCTPRPSDRWCTRTAACGTPTGARSRSANASTSRPATTVPAPARIAPIARACRPVRSVRSPRLATMWTGASPTLPGPSGASCLGAGCLARHACPGRPECGVLRAAGRVPHAGVPRSRDYGRKEREGLPRFARLGAGAPLNFRRGQGAASLHAISKSRGLHDAIHSYDSANRPRRVLMLQPSRRRREEWVEGHGEALRVARTVPALRRVPEPDRNGVSGGHDAGRCRRAAQRALGTSPTS